ncbi:hypothetical protein MTO96_044079 [Rhipicephalus appendiculatus]
MFNATTERGMVPYWYPFIGAAHCMSDRLLEEWPEWPPTQALVAMVEFASVFCCCIYGLLSEPQDESREGPRPRDERRARLRTPDHDVV